MALRIYNEFGEQIKADTIVSSKLDGIAQQLRSLVTGVGSISTKAQQLLSAVRAIVHR